MNREEKKFEEWFEDRKDLANETEKIVQLIIFAIFVGAIIMVFISVRQLLLAIA